MKYFILLIGILIPLVCVSSTSFIDQHHINVGFGGINHSTDYITVASDIPTKDPLLSPIFKMPRKGRITDIFLSGDGTTVKIDVDLISVANNSVTVINTLFNDIDFVGVPYYETNDISGLGGDLYYEFDKGDQLEFRFSYDSTLPPGEFKIFHVSYIIEWEYTSTYFDIILPTIGTWSVIVLTLILVTLGALGVRQYHRPHSILHRPEI